MSEANEPRVQRSFRGHPYWVFDHPDIHFMEPEEEESQNRFLHLTKDQSFLDIGACVGCWSIPASLICDRVVAVEPNPAALGYLSGMAQLNEIDNIWIIEGYAWDYNAATEEPYSVITTVDNIVDEQKLSNLGLIKIDVEGAELRVLHGAHKTLSTIHPRVVVEVHSAFGVTLDSIFHYFSWLDHHWSAMVMSQGKIDRYANQGSIYGQKPPVGYHVQFDYVESTCKDY